MSEMKKRKRRAVDMDESPNTNASRSNQVVNANPAISVSQLSQAHADVGSSHFKLIHQQ